MKSQTKTIFLESKNTYMYMYGNKYFEMQMNWDMVKKKGNAGGSLERPNNSLSLSLSRQLRLLLLSDWTRISQNITWNFSGVNADLELLRSFLYHL